MGIRILIVAAGLLPAAMLAGCGIAEREKARVAREVGDDRRERVERLRRAESPSDPAPSPAPMSLPAPIVGTTAPTGDLPLERSVSVETFLVGGSASAPDRVGVREILLKFRANVPNARFECRIEGAREFRDCPEGDHHGFSGLAHGSNHQLTVRARSPLGERDASPLTVAFVVDLNAGNPAADAVPVAAETLPVATSDDVGERSMQLGGFYGIVVPRDASVTSYSSDRTYNGRMQLLWRLDGIGSAYAGETCARAFERKLELAAGATIPVRSFCESTPTRNELATVYAKPLPRNHVELVREAGEKLLVAAFDPAEDADEAEARLGTSEVCAGAVASGTSPIRIVKDFYGEIQPQGMLSWCQVEDRVGMWWWIGSFVHQGAGPTPVRLRGIYAASAALGIFSGQELAVRAGRILQGALVPLTPTR